MNNPDQDMLIRALDAARTVERLLAILDRSDLVHALERIKRRRVIRLVELMKGQGDPVLLFVRIGPYRPVNLDKHIDFKQYFDPDATGKPAPEPECVADDIEAKWEKAGYPGRL